MTDELEELHRELGKTLCKAILDSWDPERSKREDFFGSIFDVIPCYGSHGPADTLEGRINREMCPECQKRCGALNIVETQ